MCGWLFTPVVVGLCQSGKGKLPAWSEEVDNHYVARGSEPCIEAPCCHSSLWWPVNGYRRISPNGYMYTGGPG